MRKNFKKKLFYLHYKFSPYIFAYLKSFTYLCTTVGVASTAARDSLPLKIISDSYA